MKVNCYAKTIAFLLFLFTAKNLSAQCGIQPTSGLITISTAGAIINSYYPGTGSPLAGATSLTVGTLDSRGSATAVAAGDLVIIMQMQGADLNTANGIAYGNGTTGSGALTTNLVAGYYEYANVKTVSGSVLTFSTGLKNNYYTRAYTTANGIQAYQVIRAPRYYDLVIAAAASVTAPAWNGTAGGVVIIDAADIVTLTGNVTAAGKGFRGGGGKNFTGATTGNSSGATTLVNTDYRFNSAVTNTANLTGGAKGEGIAGTPIYYYDGTSTVTTTNGTIEGYVGGSMGRGAPGNAGGGATDGSPVGAGTENQYNTGGGGGGNGGDGGKGGSGWDGGAGNAATYPFGGYGGTAYTAKSLQHIIMGGGGGAGSANNSTSTPPDEYYCSGAPGGGIIIARAKSYAGSGSLIADGNNAPGVTTTQSPVQTDAAGGGGGGGTVVLVTTQNGSALGMSGITVSAKGGKGGDMTNHYAHGPGGGGGGGIIYTNGTSSNGGAPISAVTAGANGLTRSTSATGPIDNPYGATSGTAGSVVTLSTAPPLTSGCGILPVTLKNFTASLRNTVVEVKWVVSDAVNLQYFVLEKSIDGNKFSAAGKIEYIDNRDDYTWMDAAPQAMNFYRIRMIDKDGSFTYSNVLLVRVTDALSESSHLVMYPNPSRGNTTLQVQVNEDQKTAIDIWDAAGKKILSKPASVKKGQNFIVLECNVAPGLYTVTMQLLTQRITGKMIILK